jgi:hypothetical protein
MAIEQIKQRSISGMKYLIANFGKPCIVVYPPITELCPNCIFDPVQQKSTGRYKTGGPIPFAVGDCPVCMGDGKVVTTPPTEETLTLLCEWNPRKFIVLPPNIEVPDGAVQTKGLIEDLPKILKARRIVIQVPNETSRRYVFDMIHEPIDPFGLMQGNFFLVTWGRVAAQ